MTHCSTSRAPGLAPPSACTSSTLPATRRLCRPSPSMRMRPAACISLSLVICSPHVSMPRARGRRRRSAPRQRDSSKTARQSRSLMGELDRGSTRSCRSATVQHAQRGSKYTTPRWRGERRPLSSRCRATAALVIPARNAPASMIASTSSASARLTVACHCGSAAEGAGRAWNGVPAPPRRRLSMRPLVPVSCATPQALGEPTSSAADPSALRSRCSTCSGSRWCRSHVPEKPTGAPKAPPFARCHGDASTLAGNCVVSSGNTSAVTWKNISSMLNANARQRRSRWTALDRSILRGTSIASRSSAVRL
mmetsp:Transcript_11369/g.37339  ORF Transcript_11369/g.37339 Transcript_11369/m.37339 type:complete len:308 (-) Transcript_11369:605-1528(-)